MDSDIEQTAGGVKKRQDVQSERILDLKGEYPVLFIFSDKKHVEYIETILGPIEGVLFTKDYPQFRPVRISEDTDCDEHFGKSFEELARTCVAAIVVLDGGRPNVWYEYGFLRALDKPLILLQSKGATINVKAFYEYQNRKSGLTEGQFEKMQNPNLGYFSFLSDRAGVRILTVDRRAKWGTKEHPYEVVKSYMDKIKSRIMDDVTESKVESTEGSVVVHFDRYRQLLSQVYSYRFDVSQFDGDDLKQCYEEAKAIEEESGSRLPSETYTSMAALYETLAERVDWRDVKKIANFKRRAIGIYEELMDTEYDVNKRANVQVRLGNCLYKLALYEDERENRKKAIKAYQEALKVYTRQRFPMDYAMTQNNLGTAYSTLAEVEAKAANCKKAIKAYQEALKVYTRQRFPMDYAMTQNNLGNAYSTLAEVEAKAANCKKAIKAYQEALKFFTEREYTELHRLVASNLARCLSFCES